jgi:hypothetical protein
MMVFARFLTLVRILSFIACLSSLVRRIGDGDSAAGSLPGPRTVAYPTERRAFAGAGRRWIRCRAIDVHVTTGRLLDRVRSADMVLLRADCPLERTNEIFEAETRYTLRHYLRCQRWDRTVLRGSPPTFRGHPGRPGPAVRLYRLTGRAGLGRQGVCQPVTPPTTTAATMTNSPAATVTPATGRAQ